MHYAASAFLMIVALAHCGAVASESTPSPDAGHDAGPTFTRFSACDHPDGCNPARPHEHCSMISAPYNATWSGRGWCMNACRGGEMEDCASVEHCVYYQGSTEGVCLPTCNDGSCPEGMACAESRGVRVCFPPKP